MRAEQPQVYVSGTRACVTLFVANSTCSYMGTWCQVTVASTNGINTSAASTSLASFQSRERQPGEGAFAMQLDAVSASHHVLTPKAQVS